MNPFNFGVDYYPEHWPEDRWATDARLMREAGINVVRLAEFAWARLEPVEGQFDFSWLDRAIETLAQLLDAAGSADDLEGALAAETGWMIGRHAKKLRQTLNSLKKGVGP